MDVITLSANESVRVTVVGRRGGAGAGAGAGVPAKEEEQDDAPAGPPPRCSVIDEHATVASLRRANIVTGTYVRRVAATPQHDPFWFFARSGSVAKDNHGALVEPQLRARGFELPEGSSPAKVTGSVTGAMAGHNPHQTSDDALRNMIFPQPVNNAAVAYGTMTEDVGRQMMYKALFLLSGGRLEVEELGLCMESPLLACGKDKTTGETLYDTWCGVSPDGVAHILDEHGRRVIAFLIEIKSKFYMRHMFYSDSAKHNRFRIPWYYYDQVQFVMGIMVLPATYFVVYLPDRTQVQVIRFNKEYFSSLFNCLRDFYFQRYLPAAVMRMRGLLTEGQLPAEADLSEVLTEASARAERTIAQQLRDLDATT